MSLSPAERSSADVLIDLALREDLDEAGDITSAATIPAEKLATAAFVVRRPGTIAGLPVAEAVCKRVDPRLRFEAEADDGHRVERGTTIAIVAGPLRSILAAERTALNFLQRLSGVATLTRQYVDAIAGLPVKLLDTRKTTPGWRLLEKYAVRCGGGTNHRIGLFDAFLIKDNHIAGLGDPSTAVLRSVELARAFPTASGRPIEVEVDSLDQLEQVLPANPEIVLLDNMVNDLLREAVGIRNRLQAATLLEASGGVNLATIRGIAETGVDRISVGAITHSATALDIALDLLD